MKRLPRLAVATAIFITAALPFQAHMAFAASPTKASADLHDATGKSVGTATLKQTGTGLSVHVAAKDLPPGIHGVHIHTVGTCTAPDFQSAGGHWNPTGKKHGKDNPDGMHQGDLPNLTIGADGRGSLDYTVPGVSLSGGAVALLDADGAAIVVHAQADDYHTDPSGNSGGRIACGVLH